MLKKLNAVALRCIKFMFSKAVVHFMMKISKVLKLVVSEIPNLIMNVKVYHSCGTNDLVKYNLDDTAKHKDDDRNIIHITSTLVNNSCDKFIGEASKHTEIKCFLNDTPKR